MQPVGIKISVDGGKAFRTELTDIAAKARQLESEMTKVTATFDKNATAQDKARAKMKVLGNQMQNLKSRLTTLKTQEKQQADNLKRIAAELDKAKQKYGLNSTQVQKLTATYQRQETALARTRTEINRAETSLAQMEGEMKDLQATANKFNGNLKMEQFAASCEKASGKLRSVGMGMKSAGITMGIAAGSMILVGKKLIDSALVQSDAERKLAEIYKTRMGVGKKAASETMKVASALQKAGVIGDEVTLSGAQQLATYAKFPSTVNALLPAMDNLLVQQKGLNATAEDATSIANLFGKAMMGQTGALKRVGISFTEEQEQVLKFGTEEEKAAMLSEVVTQNVGNMNKEFAKTDAGKMQQAANELGDLGEQIGAALLPAVADLVGYLQKNVLPIIENIVGFIQGHPIVGKIIVAIAGFLAVTSPLMIVLGSLASFIANLMTILPAILPIIAGLSAPILGVVAAIAAAVAIGIVLWKNWDTIKEAIINAWNRIKEGISNAVSAIKERVTTNLEAIKNVFKTIWNGIKTVVGIALQGIQTVISTYINMWKTIISVILNGIKFVFVRVFGGIKTTVINAFNSIKSVTSAVWNGIKNAMIKPIETAQKTIKKIIDKVKGFFPIKVGNLLKGIKLPHFKITGSFSIVKKTVPKLGISWYKKAATEGAVFNSPQIIGVGDASQPEMLIGQNTLKDMFANNTGGMDPALMYEAVRQGASDATIQAYMDNREVTRALRGLGVAFI